MNEDNTIHAKQSPKKTPKALAVTVSVNGLKYIIVLAIILSLSGCGILWGIKAPSKGKSYAIKGQRYYIMESAQGYRDKGQASWYGEPFHGRKTASGEIYNMYKVTAAHKTLPLQTWVEVRNLDNNKKLTVRINDRGPFVRGRIIDLSWEAAKKIDMLNTGVARVSVKAITGKRAQLLTEAENRHRKLATKTSPTPSAGDM